MCIIVRFMSMVWITRNMEIVRVHNENRIFQSLMKLVSKLSSRQLQELSNENQVLLPSSSNMKNLMQQSSGAAHVLRNIDFHG